MIDMKRLEAAIPKNIMDDVDFETLDEMEETLYEDNGQTLWSTLLEECPFCGHDRPFIQTYRYGDFTWDARVVCQNCHVATRYEANSTKVIYLPTGKDYSRLIAMAKAILMWNRRSKTNE